MTPGRTVAIEFRWAEGRTERFAEIAAEFVRLKVDVIIAAGGHISALAAHEATKDIPIVFTNLSDPIGSGIVGSARRVCGERADNHRGGGKDDRGAAIADRGAGHCAVSSVWRRFRLGSKFATKRALLQLT